MKKERNRYAEARIGADRMAAGLSCIPHQVKGDYDHVVKLSQRIKQLENCLQCMLDDSAYYPQLKLHEFHVRSIQSNLKK